MKNFIRVIITLIALVSAYGAERSDKKPSSRTPPRESATATKIDINTADAATLETLPGVGPQVAREIVAGRPFKSVDDLARVRGIGAARLADIRDYATASQPAKRQGKAGRIDLNTADRSTLEGLPGIGPEIADAIIAARPFKSVDDLEDVRGIGPARMADLRPYVTVSSPRAAVETRRSNQEKNASRSSNAREPATTTYGKVNLNTASREELEALPEIGPVKAQAIIDARPFSSVEDVMRVKGIKEGTFEAIRDKITVR